MSTLVIDIDELSDGSAFKIYDRTDWSPAFDYTNVTNVLVTVTYNSTDYTLELVDTGESKDLIGMDSNFTNLFGSSCTANYEVACSSLLDGSSSPLAEERFEDGFYQIKLEVTYTGEGDMEDTSDQGFMAHAECRATLAPLKLDFDNFDYHYNRSLFLLIAELDSAKFAASLGRSTQFTTILNKITDFLDANNISRCW